MSRCTGHCCKSFWLPISPMEFKYLDKRVELKKSIKWNLDDYVKIADMVIFQRPSEKGGYRYTCKFFDSESGNCTNYENRPTMCKDYPYGNNCTFKKCTLAEKV